MKSVYNLNDKQIVKLFSRILGCNQDTMVRDLEQVCRLRPPSRDSCVLTQTRLSLWIRIFTFLGVTPVKPSPFKGDVSETVRMFFEESESFPAATKSLLTIQEVDASLTRLAQLTKEDEQQTELEYIAKK